MEAVAALASVITVLQLSHTVAELCFRCRRREGARRILDEVMCLHVVLGQLRQLMESDGKNAVPRLRSLRELTATSDLISQYQAALTKIEMRLAPTRGRWSKAGRSLLWPLTESELRITLDSIRNFKEGIMSLLAADHG